MQKKIITATYPISEINSTESASDLSILLNNFDGIIKAEVDSGSSTLFLKYNSSIITIEEIKSHAEEAGFEISKDQPLDSVTVQHIKLLREKKKLKRRTILSTILALPIIAIGLYIPEHDFGKYISIALTLAIMLVPGFEFYRSSIRAATKGRANMDTLVTLSTSIAYIFSIFNTIHPQYLLDIEYIPHVYYETIAVIITFIILGKYLEENAKSKSSQAIRKLVNLRPKIVTIIDFKGDIIEVKIDKVEVGQILLVRPGDKIPVDGVVVEGSSYVDEAMITGESMPKKKYNGTKVFAGTINLNKSFHIKALKVGDDTLLAQIIDAVQLALISKTPKEKIVDKIAAIFVPSVIVLSIITFCAWILLGYPLPYAILTSISVLIIACPCALGLATPSAIIIGIGIGAQNNILVKDPKAFRIGEKVKHLLFDKTGVITEGKPKVTEILWSSDVNDIDTPLSVLLSLESRAKHPIAASVVKHLKEKKIEPAEILNFCNRIGQGVECTDVDGNRYLIGNRLLLEDNNIEIEESLDIASSDLQHQCKTTAYFAVNDKALAIIAIADKVRDSAADAIKVLKKMGYKIHLITGDNRRTTKAVASSVGIKSYKYEMTPHDKAKIVQSFQRQGERVAMIGDGINDSHALAQSDLSLAMSSGSDIAIDVADVTINSPNLHSICRMLRLSRKVQTGIRQNLFWAFIYNLIGIPLAAGVLFPINGFLLDPMLAGVAMAISSLSVIANSLRLKKIKL